MLPEAAKQRLPLPTLTAILNLAGEGAEGLSSSGLGPAQSICLSARTNSQPFLLSSPSLRSAYAHFPQRRQDM